MKQLIAYCRFFWRHIAAMNATRNALRIARGLYEKDPNLIVKLDQIQALIKPSMSSEQAKRLYTLVYNSTISVVSNPPGKAGAILNTLDEWFPNLHPQGKIPSIFTNIPSHD